MGRFKQNLYNVQIVVFNNGRNMYVESDDGTLFSGTHRTKILPQDLPEWYAFGRYYKRFGYMSTKGITDLLYVPNKFTNHFLKDDALFISYGGTITENPAPVENGVYRDKYVGYDYVVWGSEIITILMGARTFSDYDITEIVDQIKEKKEWLIKKYPNEFGADQWSFDVEKRFAEPFENGLPPKYFAISLNNYFTPSYVSFPKRYYGTLEEIQAYIESLDYEDNKLTINAFREYLDGNINSMHDVACAKCKLLEPVTFIKQAFLFLSNETWDFVNVWGYTYTMRVKSAHMNAILIKDGDKYIRCIRPTMEGLYYRRELSDAEDLMPIHNFLGCPGMMSYEEKAVPVVRSALYLPEKRYDDVKTAVAELRIVNPSLDIVCEDIFADG